LSLSDDGKWLALYDGKLGSPTAALPELDVFEVPNNNPKYSKVTANHVGFALASGGARIGEVTTGPSCGSNEVCFHLAITDLAFATTYATWSYGGAPGVFASFVLSPDGTRSALTLRRAGRGELLTTAVFNGSDQTAGPLDLLQAAGWLTNDSFVANFYKMEGFPSVSTFAEAQLLDPTGTRVSPAGSWAYSVPGHLQVSRDGTRVFIPPDIFDSNGKQLWNGSNDPSLMAGSHVLYLDGTSLYDLEPPVLQ
jgi:hypothetical protein